MMAIENGVKSALIKFAVFILISWSGWATAQILDLKEHKAYTKGHGEEFERTILDRLDTIERKIDDLQTR